MTMAFTVTRTVNQASCGPDLRAYSFTEHRQAIRSAIIAARPVMRDDQSRQAKLLVARKIWNVSVPVKGTIAETYFEQCGFVYEPEVMGPVRFNPVVLFEPTREHHPALIAPVRDLNGEFVGIQKTYLATDGKSRAKVQGEPRRLLGRCHGSYVQLSDATGFRLVVTDSLETGLAIQQACPGFPVWSAMTPGNMRARVPEAVKELILCPDGDVPNKELLSKLVQEAVREHMDRGVRVSLAQDIPAKSFSQIV